MTESRPPRKGSRARVARRGGGGMWLMGTIMMLAFVGLIAYAIRAIAWRSRDDARPAIAPADPTKKGREILAERYARGEIDGEEYRTKLRDLGGPETPRAPSGTPL